MKNKRYIFWVLLALVLICVGLWYWWNQKPAIEKSKEKEPPAPTPTQYNSNSNACALTKSNWGLPGKTILKKGSKGCAVTLLQKALNQVYSAKLLEDGVFGTKTDDALTDALKIGGWGPTTYVGQITLELLDKAAVGKVYKLFT